MKHLIKLVKLLVFGVGGLVACMLLLGWALARHDKQEAPRPDLSNLAWDTKNDSSRIELCGIDEYDSPAFIRQFHLKGPKRPHYLWMECQEEDLNILRTANQILRVEASGLQNHDLDIAVSLDSDRRELAAMVKDFRAKWQPPVKK